MFACVTSSCNFTKTFTIITNDLAKITVEFKFFQWGESNGLTPKIASTLKDKDLDVAEAVKLLSTNIAKLGLTKGQTNCKWNTNTSSASQRTKALTSEKLDNEGGLVALCSCGGLDDLPPSFHSTIPLANQVQGDTTRVDLNPHVYLGKPSAGKEEKPLFIPDFVEVYSGSTEPEEQG